MVEYTRGVVRGTDSRIYKPDTYELERRLHMTERDRLRFFGLLLQDLEGRGFKPVSGRYEGKHTRAFWVNARLGREIRYGVVLIRKEVRVELIIDGEDAKDIFDKLEASKIAIERRLRLGNLRWDRKDSHKRTCIATVRPGMTKEDDPEDVRKWIIRRIERFKRVFDTLLLDIVQGRP